MDNKQKRHFIIKEILEKDAIPSQEKLRVELKKKGLKITQATLSRDLKELGISRFSSSNGSKYVPQKNESVKSLGSLIIGEIVSIKSNENLIVVSTLPGCASVIGEYIDVQKSPEIIGTIAGDNTLLIIPKSVKKIKQIMIFLNNILIEGKSK